MRIIRLVVSDVDGVLNHGLVAPLDFPALHRIAELNRAAEGDPAIPLITFCTGRQQPYLELLLQAIDSRIPALWESGAGLYDPARYDFHINPDLDRRVVKQLPEVRAAVYEAIVAPGLGVLQPGKDLSLSIMPRAPMTVEDLLALLPEVLAAFPDFEVQDATLCANVQPVGVDKGSGLRWLAEYLGYELADIAAIGDSTSDLSFLEIAGWSAAPANAHEAVRAAVDYVSPYPVSTGLIDILDHLIDRNRQLLARG